MFSKECDIFNIMMYVKVHLKFTIQAVFMISTSVPINED